MDNGGRRRASVNAVHHGSARGQFAALRLDRCAPWAKRTYIEATGLSDARESMNRLDEIWAS